MILAQSLFVKLLALTFFFAFFSLARQVKGLFGENGLSPMRVVKWLGVDRNLILAWLGVGLSVTAYLGIYPVIPFLFLFLIYRFFLFNGYPFLSFQWDALLVETGFVALFYALISPPAIGVLIWLWILAFRLMVSSGAVKLLSKCPEWRNFTAMRYHFETQPLPNFGGFLAHNLFMPITKFVCGGVYLFELIIPFLFFGTPFLQMLGAVSSILFQIVLMVTGNFAFFNLLTITLFIPLLHDSYLAWGELFLPSIVTLPSHLYLEIALNAIGGIMGAANLLLLLHQIGGLKSLPKPIRFLLQNGFMSTYGLFARMTTIRNEIVIEGSEDGVTWKEYHFKFKPGALNSGTKQIAPLQPRLDWQMWFAALSSYRQELWFQYLLFHLQKGTPEIVALLEKPPYATPKFIRAKFYRYKFNSIKVWWKTGEYWQRLEGRMYSP